ncbi:MAG: hypothetical protein IV097_11670 [Burkholderiaceae bacterium]|nr:hypothetical protein [Burkholderiaceae bacterium]
MSSEYFGATASAEQEVNIMLGILATGREQDWEIEFADVRKIDLMLDALENQSLSLDVKSALCLLIVSSFEAAFDEGEEDLERMNRAARLLLRDPSVADRMRFYWLGLGRTNHPNLTRFLLTA